MELADNINPRKAQTRSRRRSDDPLPESLRDDRGLSAAATAWGSTLAGGATGAGLGAAVGGPVGAALGAAFGMPVGAYLGATRSLKEHE